MASDLFLMLSREEKDMYYEQCIVMNRLVQVFGKHLEFSGQKFTHKSGILSEEGK